MFLREEVVTSFEPVLFKTNFLPGRLMVTPESPSKLFLFGGFCLEIEGKEALNVPRPVQELLAVLADSGDAGMERDQIASAVWPENDPERARFYLRRSLSQLRTLVGKNGPLIKSREDGRLCLDAKCVYCDLTELDALSRRKGPIDLKGIQSLYRGPLLPGAKSTHVRHLRSKYRDQIVRTLILAGSEALDANDLTSAREIFEKAIQLDPIRETTVRELMRVAGRQGDFAGVVRALRDLRRQLQKTLNILPSQETSNLYRELMTLAHIAESTAPIDTTYDLNIRSLPPETSPFIGREAEVAALIEAIDRSRLVTVTGVGGVGKSRLAANAASQLAPKFSNVAYVDLTPCAAPDDLSELIARVFDVDGNRSDRLASSVSDRCGSSSTLLIIDGLDRNIAEASSFIKSLLRLNENVRIICTSRVRLFLSEEALFHLEPFDTEVREGRVKSLPGSEAAAYLLAKITQNSPNFQLTTSNRSEIIRICQRLDGLPLALDLAAARLRSMPEDKVLESLDDRFEFLDRSSGGVPAERSLMATLELSRSLLSEEESLLFARLSVFPASFSAWAAQEICHDQDLPSNRISILLGNLVDQSLVEYSAQSVDGRYRLLETVRAYAKSCLSDETMFSSLRNRHAEYYLKSSEMFVDNATERERFRLNETNYAWALNWFGQSHDRTLQIKGVKLINRLFPYWSVSGSLSSGIATGLRTIDLCGPEPEDAVAECLIRCGGAAHVLYSLPLAAQLFARAEAMADQLGLDAWVAQAVMSQGEVAANAGNLEEAKTLLTRALEMAEFQSDEIGQAKALGTLGYVARMQMDLTEAQRLTEEAMTLYISAANEEGRLWCAGSLAAIHLSDRRPELAIPLFQETLEHQRVAENKLAQAWNLTSLAICYRMLGDYERAEATVRKAIGSRDVGERDLAAAWQLIELGEIQRLNGNRNEAEQTLQEALRTSRDAGATTLEARAMTCLAHLFADRGDFTSARAYRGSIKKLALEGGVLEINDQLAELDARLTPEPSARINL